MIEGVIVIFSLALVFGLVVWWVVRNMDRNLEAMRHERNARMREIHKGAHYPHELADGTIRWYLPEHVDAMDL